MNLRKVGLSLDLWNDRIGDAGARALAEALESNQILTSLNLMSIRIGDIGVRALAPYRTRVFI